MPGQQSASRVAGANFSAVPSIMRKSDVSFDAGPESDRDALERMWDPSSRVNIGWYYALSGEDATWRKGRRLRGLLPGGRRCKNCNAPFDGLGGRLMRWRGRGRYDRNPNFCNF